MCDLVALVSTASISAFLLIHHEVTPCALELLSFVGLDERIAFEGALPRFYFGVVGPVALMDDPDAFSWKEW